jgi:hypothetical protein
VLIMITENIARNGVPSQRARAAGRQGRSVWMLDPAFSVVNRVHHPAERRLTVDPAGEPDRAGSPPRHPDQRFTTNSHAVEGAILRPFIDVF